MILKIIFNVVIKIVVFVPLGIFYLYEVADRIEGETISEFYNVSVQVTPGANYYLVPCNKRSLYQFSSASGGQGFKTLEPKGDTLHLKYVNYFCLGLVEQGAGTKKFYSVSYDTSLRGYNLVEANTSHFTITGYVLYHVLKAGGMFLLLFLSLFVFDFLFLRRFRIAYFLATAVSALSSFVFVFIVVYQPFYGLFF